MKKDYYKQLNIIRLVSCIAILLYHLGVFDMNPISWTKEK